MDRERAYLVATPFKKRGKRSLKVSDFIFAISLDLKWGSPDKVRALLEEASDEGLVKVEGDMVHANFDEEKVNVPLGFKPTREEGVLEKALRLISSETGMNRKEVIAMANERQESLLGLVDLEVVALLVAREMGIDVRDLTHEAYQILVTGGGPEKKVKRAEGEVA